MRALRGDQRGFTLIELIVAMSLMMIVLGATLTAFTDFTNANQRVEQQNDAQNRARLASDALARELRNMASPTDGLTNAIDKAESYDLVFKSVDQALPGGSQNTRSLRRIRYCFDSSLPTNGRLWRQVQTWTSSTVPAVLSTASCPGSGWPTTILVADKMSNRVGGADRPVFSYLYRGGQTTPNILSLRTDLFVDVTSKGSPAETRLSSGVFLRNQNRSPQAVFNVTLTVNPGSLVFNGSASSDPEGKNLTYEWYVDGSQTPVGTGLIYNYAVTGPRVVNVTLKVYDPAGLAGTAGPQAVNVP
jgi:prepilin-type N-terminal cleavage/methylation domain-containing protein